MKRKILLEIIVYLFVFLFFYTAGMKVTDFGFFKGMLHKSPLISPIAPLVAILVPSAEILIILLLVFNKTRLYGLYCAAALMSLFSLYVGYMLLFYKGINLPCSCGGVIELMNWRQHLYFNVFFSILGGIGIWIYRRTNLPNQSALTSLR